MDVCGCSRCNLFLTDEVTFCFSRLSSRKIGVKASYSARRLALHNSQPLHRCTAAPLHCCSRLKLGRAGADHRFEFHAIRPSIYLSIPPSIPRGFGACYYCDAATTQRSLNLSGRQPGALPVQDTAGVHSETPLLILTPSLSFSPDAASWQGPAVKKPINPSRALSTVLFCGV